MFKTMRLGEPGDATLSEIDKMVRARMQQPDKMSSDPPCDVTLELGTARPENSGGDLTSGASR